LPLFELSDAYQSVYRWFQHLSKEGCHVVGFVIMPNHLHALLYLSHSGTSLNKMVGEGKRFMAYDIVSGLKRSGKEDILKQLEDGVQKKERLKGKKHQVFRLSFDARLCYNEKMIEQKLDYIHHNPVSGRWNLVEDFCKYEHSSASFYEEGVVKVNVNLVHYKDLDSEFGIGSRSSESSYE
jgi:REP element-mobilizing transposase RayT